MDFHRDVQVESAAYAAGYSMDRIKKTRLCDLKKIVSDSIPVVKITPQYNDPPTPLPSPVIASLPSSSVDPPPLDSRAGEIARAEAYLSMLKRKKQENGVDVRDMCKAPDAPQQIQAYYNSICSKYKHAKSCVAKKKLLLKDIDMDEEDESLCTYINRVDYENMDKCLEQIRQLVSDLKNVILRKESIIKILNESSSVDNQMTKSVKTKIKNLKLILDMIVRETER